MPSYHGSPHRFGADCRTDRQCPNYGTRLPTCAQAALKYRGDWEYIKQVDAGLTPAEIVDAAEAVAAETARVAVEQRAARTPAKPKRKPQPKRATTTFVTKGVIGPDGRVHGTIAGYKRCKDPDGCPAVTAGLKSCLVVGREAGRANYVPTGTRRKVAVHGTASGYAKYKCRDRQACPAAVAGGMSCGEATSIAGAARHKAKKERQA